jgi:hypothetical protein
MELMAFSERSNQESGEGQVSTDATEVTNPVAAIGQLVSWDGERKAQ